MTENIKRMDRLGLAVAAFGALVLVGWQLDIEILKSFLHPEHAMNPLSAICFIFAGLALQFSRGAKVGWPLQCLPILVILIAGLKVAHAAGFAVAADQIFFAEKLAGNSMAPNSVISFVTVSLGLLSINTRWRKIHPMPFCALLVIFLGSVALTGYLYKAEIFYQFKSNIPMSLNSAFAFVVLGVGLINSRPTYEPVSTILSPRLGGKVARRLVPFSIFFPIVLGWFRLQGEYAGLYNTSFGVSLFAIVSAVVTGGFVWWAAKYINRFDKEREFLLDLLAKKAMIDGLTGLWNRRHFDERLLAEIALFQRYQKPFSCILLDVDHFKNVNDSFGHPQGDEVLQMVSQVLTKNSRQEDVACRYGGEEFALLLPCTELQGAKMLAERIRKEIEGREFSFNGSTARVTCSFGVAQAKLGQNHLLIERADHALYKAKRGGRNQVVTESSS